MNKHYILAIDQSTQGTKAMIFDEEGTLIRRTDKSHHQIIDEHGWISHDCREIYQNVLDTAQLVTDNIDRSEIIALAISNQRETSLIWDKITGEPLADAIVWQCTRSEAICECLEKEGKGEEIRKRTGLNLSPYFPASKIEWLLRNVDGAEEKSMRGELCCGTIDSWLIYKLTGGKSYKTDYSNASRTELFNIFDLRWDEEICSWFGINARDMPEVCDSNTYFGETDLEGLLPNPIPIHAVMGDSHGALFGQGCIYPGMVKATYGTGSSIMMNIGEKPMLSEHGLVTSLAWRLDGDVNYVLEGNLNYTGAVITWLKDSLGLFQSPEESEEYAKNAVQDDSLYLVPAFSGLGAPYWDSQARAAIIGMDRTTGKKEIIRAGLECIAYQIEDILTAMSADTFIKIDELCVDGGPAKNAYLMQFQSDMAEVPIQVPMSEELSGIGVAYVAGIAMGIWDESIFGKLKRERYEPEMDREKRKKKYDGWKQAVSMITTA